MSVKMELLTRKLKLLPAEKLAVRIWASAVVATSGLPASKFYLFYPTRRRRDGTKVESSAFANSLANGGSPPLLLLADGSDGPALAIEREYPGTLKWLIHPMWEVLQTKQARTIEDVQRRMAVLEPAVVDVLFVSRGDYLRRKRTDIVDQLKPLRQLGSLDAMAAVLYLQLEAEALSDRRSELLLQRFVRRHLKDWPCLRWMDVSNQRNLRVLYEGRFSAGHRVPIFREVDQLGFAGDIMRRMIPATGLTHHGVELSTVELLVEYLNAPEAS